MGWTNDSQILNSSTRGGGDDGDVLEAYTVVLSVAAHALSTLIGGGGSIAVVVAITSSHSIKKHSYALVLMLLLACCSLNFVWSPLQVADLVMFHHGSRRLHDRFVIIKTALYLLIILITSISITLLSVESIIRKKNGLGRPLKKVWSLTSSVFALVLSVGLVSTFLVKCEQWKDDGHFSYTVLDKDTRSVTTALIVLAPCLVGVVATIVVMIMIKDAFYCENGRPHLKHRKIKLEIPEFLISQSNARADNDAGFEPSKSGPPSPSTPKLLIVGDPETSSIKGEDSSHISDLPRTVAKPVGSRLGINMSQILGRRRHTICQISDSSSAASTPMDPMARAKQYNYVRKFSVDIAALQAQLQNPKIFRDAPYQSDIDICKKARSQAPQTLTLMQPLPRTADEEERVLENKLTVADNPTKIPSPPVVIMVSNEDVPASTSNTPNKSPDPSDTFHEDTKANNSAGDAALRASSLDFTQSGEDHISVPTLESAASSHSHTENGRMTRLTVQMALTFVLTMVPVFVVELIQSILGKHAYINIFTCALAISSIQTIVYPHLLASNDDAVHKAVQKLKNQSKSFCQGGSRETDAPRHAEECSSPGHV